jgi:hypothetical protein
MYLSLEILFCKRNAGGTISRLIIMRPYIATRNQQRNQLVVLQHLPNGMIIHFNK